MANLRLLAKLTAPMPVGSSAVLGIIRHDKLNKTKDEMAVGENPAESFRESVAKKLIANPKLQNLSTLESSLPKPSPANQKLKSKRAAR